VDTNGYSSLNAKFRSLERERHANVMSTSPRKFHESILRNDLVLAQELVKNLFLFFVQVNPSTPNVGRTTDRISILKQRLGKAFDFTP